MLLSAAPHIRPGAHPPRMPDASVRVEERTAAALRYPARLATPPPARLDRRSRSARRVGRCAYTSLAIGGNAKKTSPSRTNPRSTERALTVTNGIGIAVPTAGHGSAIVSATKA